MKEVENCHTGIINPNGSLYSFPFSGTLSTPLQHKVVTEAQTGASEWKKVLVRECLKSMGLATGFPDLICNYSPTCFHFRLKSFREPVTHTWWIKVHTLRSTVLFRVDCNCTWSVTLSRTSLHNPLPEWLSLGQLRVHCCNRHSCHHLSLVKVIHICIQKCKHSKSEKSSWHKSFVTHTREDTVSPKKYSRHKKVSLHTQE